MDIAVTEDALATSYSIAFCKSDGNLADKNLKGRAKSLQSARILNNHLFVHQFNYVFNIAFNTVQYLASTDMVYSATFCDRSTVVCFTTIHIQLTPVNRESYKGELQYC